MADKPGPVLAPAEFTDAEGFEYVSTSATPEELQEQFAATEEKPDEKAEKPLDEKTDAAFDKQAETKEPVKEAKPDPKTPEGRKAQLQSEINAFVREKHTNKAEAEQAKREVEERRAELAAINRELDEKRRAVAPPKEDAKAEATERAPEPKEEDFDEFRDWVKAHNQWGREQAVLDAKDLLKQNKEQEQTAQTEAQRRQQEQARADYEAKVQAEYWDRLQKYLAEHPEAKTALSPEHAGSLPINPMMEQHFRHSPNGPALMRHLVENPGECERISQLAPGPTLVELGKIERDLELSVKSGSDTKTKPITRAAAPVNPVGSGAAVADDDTDDPERMPIEKYIKVMDAREKALGGSRRRL